jgi:predicted NodU family carbamoyl transferase
VNEAEYKVMGIAPYGEPRFVDELSCVLRTYEDGSFWLDLDDFSFHYSARKAYTDKLPALREPGRGSGTSPSIPTWYQGRFEFGPRAVGNRSVLADLRLPRDQGADQRVDQVGEPFQPFAPAATEELAETLVSPEQAHQHPARFTLLIYELEPQIANRIGAVNDSAPRGFRQSARPGTLRFFHLLERLGERTELPVLLNTCSTCAGSRSSRAAMKILDWLRRGDEESRKKPQPDEDEWPEEDELPGDEDDPTVYPLW